MNVALGVAGIVCIAMSFGHTAIGVKWVLPAIGDAKFPASPFGGSSMSATMIRVTWFVVTIFAAGVGITLILLAWAPELGARAIFLRATGIMWSSATVMACTVAFRRTRSLRTMFRLPVPFLWLGVAIICWLAA